jgi:hypothetical protein
MRTEPLSWVCAGVRPVALCQGAQAAALPGAGVQGEAHHGQQLLLQGLPGDRVPEAPLWQRPLVPGARRRAPARACAARLSCSWGEPVCVHLPPGGDLAGRELPAAERGPCSAGCCAGSPTCLHLAPSSTPAAFSKVLLSAKNVLQKLLLPGSLFLLRRAAALAARAPAASAVTALRSALGLGGAASAATPARASARGDGVGGGAASSTARPAPAPQPRPARAQPAAAAAAAEAAQRRASGQARSGLAACKRCVGQQHVMRISALVHMSGRPNFVILYAAC